MRVTTVIKAMALLALLAGASTAGIKYIAVVETDIDAQSGASATLTYADARLVTAELRREAVKNLPRDRYNIMTSETVQSMGGAVLEECAEENCVIALGSKIGADYIVRGTISKFQTKFTLTIEVYETDNGTLVASSDPVRSENVGDLLEKVAAASADMYRTFAAAQSSTAAAQSPAPKAAATYDITVTVNPPDGGVVLRDPYKADYEPGTKVTLTATPASGYAFIGWAGAGSGKKNRITLTMDKDKAVTANFYRKDGAPDEEISGGRNVGGGDHEAEAAERKPMTGFSLGCSFSLGGGHVAAQLGVVHSRPISESMVSLNLEGNIWAGEAFPYSDDDFGFFGLNVPMTVLLQLNFFSLEVGVDGDLLLGNGETLFNAGFVVGAGIGFSKKHSRRYFYRYCGGINYGTHIIGMWWLF
jgi:TolB-like protein